jgi:hypothetical protein
MNEQILNLAKTAIQSHLTHKKIPLMFDLVSKYPNFSKQTATFVTLKINGNLRGCIGSLIAHRTLYDDLVSNAIAAAFKDPRFKPLSLEEFQHINIEVSLLSQPVIVNYKDIEDLKSKIKVGVDGIILKKDQYQATFLPQVWEELNDFDLFFTHLCNKAGLNKNCLNSYPQIYKYQVKKIN